MTSSSTSKPLRLRLRLALRYYAWLWHGQTPKERFGVLWRLLGKLPFLPLSLFLWVALFLSELEAKRGKVGGITVLDSVYGNGPTFLRVTSEALHLIEQVDPRRFRRIQREVRSIENRPQPALGTYKRSARRCSVNFASLPCTWTDPTDSDYHWYLSMYAAVLVHEATHGHCRSLGIPYIRSTRVDIERLCVEEEHRFALRLFPDDREYADALVPPLDEGAYQESWRLSLWQRACSQWQASQSPCERR